MSESSGGRRSFLHPKNLGKVVSSITGGEWPDFSSPSSTQEGEDEGLLYRVGKPAMACQFEILFEVLDADLMPVAESALSQIDDLEAQLSVYRDSSQVCAINREAFDHPVEVEPGLFDLLQECKQIWEETGGAFDISIQALLEAWGMFCPPRRNPSQSEIEAALTRCGMDAVELDPEKHTVRFHRPGLGLNLGAVGKGYALERVAEHLKQHRMEHFLIHGGGSSMLARGSSTWEHGWLAGVTTPFDWSTPIAHVRLENKALSTSAVEAEALRGETQPHILDPRLGQPVKTDLVSATVITASASRAEGLSTAFLVMGLDKVLEYCEKHTDVGAVLLQWSPGDTGFEVIHTGIPKHSLEVLS